MNWSSARTALLADAWLQKVAPDKMEKAALLLHHEPTRFVMNDSISTFEQWRKTQSDRKATRIYAIPWNKHSATDESAKSTSDWRDWSQLTAYSTEGGIAVEFLPSTGAGLSEFETYFRKGHEFVFFRRTTIRPSIAQNPSHHIRDDFRNQLKEVLLLAEDAGELRWVNNIRRRLAKLRITPHPFDDLTEGLHVLNLPDSSIQLLATCLGEPYIFERFQQHHQFDLETSRGTVPCDFIFRRDEEIEDFETFAIDVAVNSSKQKVAP